MIGTDQNFNFIDIQRHPRTQDLLDLFISNGYLPTVTIPTRITHSTSTLIGNIYARFKDLDDLTSGVITIDISDHLPLFLFIGKPHKTKTRTKEITCRPMDEDKLVNMSTHLNQIDWTVIHNMNPNQANEHFTKILMEALNNFIPEKTIKIPYKNIIRQAWMTKELLQMSITKDKMYRKCINKPKTSLAFANFTKYRNNFNRLKRSSKKEYYAAKLKLYSSDLKKTWAILKTLIGKTNDKSTISEMFKIDGVEIKEPKIIANKFCEYFTGIGQKFASQIPSPQKHFSHHLRHNNPSSFFMMPTNTMEVSELLKSLKPKNSTGHDGLSSKLIKTLSSAISCPISIIINKSFETGVVPNSMKIAKIIPIFKAKDKTEMGNYRPISLLPTISKILEKAVHCRLYAYCKSKNILYEDQYGFRPKHSTTDAIAKFIAHIATS